MNPQRLLDRFSILASGVCILHCLAMPVLLVLVPLLASVTPGDAEFHRLLLIVVLPCSSLALLLGCRRHKDGLVLALGLAGMALLIATAVLGHALLGETGERLATVLGGAALMAGHYRNHRLCRDERCDN